MKRSKKKINVKIIFIILIVIVLFGVIGYSVFSGETTNRPKHCIDNRCIDSIVFSRLPSYPENFDEIDLGVYFGKYGWNEHFSPKAPDEYYWKQPEFYPEFEVAENIEYYLSVKNIGNGKVEYSGVRVGVSGYGVYPGDTVVSNIHTGEDLKVVTYLHAGWFIEKYQGMELKVVYPNRGEVKLGANETVSVIQDPDEVKNYFDVNLTPSLVLLEPSFPVFQPNWTQKITVIAHVKENTPAGDYLIGITPFEPPPEKSDEWVYQYGIFKYVDAGMADIGRPHLQIFVRVV